MISLSEAGGDADGDTPQTAWETRMQDHSFRMTEIAMGTRFFISFNEQTNKQTNWLCWVASLLQTLIKKINY